MKAAEFHKRARQANKQIAALVAASDRPGYTNDFGAWLKAATQLLADCGLTVDTDGIYCGDDGMASFEIAEANGNHGFHFQWHRMQNPPELPLRRRYEMNAYVA